LSQKVQITFNKEFSEPLLYMYVLWLLTYLSHFCLDAKVPKNQVGEFPKQFASVARYESKAPPERMRNLG